MISFGVIGDLSHVRDRLAHWANVDLLPLANKIAETIKLDNELSVGMDGIDANGEPFDPILDSMWWRGRGGEPKGRPNQGSRGGFGPPLAPRFRSSRIVSGFKVSVEVDSSGYLIIAGWPGLDWVKYHQKGFKVHTREGDRFIEPRPVMSTITTSGLRPSVEIVISEQVANFVEGLARGEQ